MRSIDTIEVIIKDSDKCSVCTRCDAELPTGEEVKLRPLTSHGLRPKFRTLRKYKLKNVKLDDRGGVKHLRSTAGTTIKEIPPQKLSDTVNIAALEKVIDESWETRYNIINTNGAQQKLRLYPEHDLKHIYSNRLYIIENLRKSNVKGTTYLESKSNTKIQQLVDPEFNIELFVIGDTHIGYRNIPNNIRNHQENICRRSFESLVGQSLVEGIDGIVHTGDLFEEDEPNDDDVEWVKKQVERLQDADISLVCIRGNHDPTELPNKLINMNNFTHINSTQECERFGFRLVGYGCDNLSNPEELNRSEFNQEILFIHPYKWDFNKIQTTDVCNQEAWRSIIFSGHRHSPGKTHVQGTPLIFTGSPGGLSKSGERSIFRAGIWNQEVVVTNKLVNSGSN